MPNRFEKAAIDPRWGLLYLLAPAIIFLSSFIKPLIGISVGILIVLSWLSIAATERFTRHGSNGLIASIVFAFLVAWFAGFPNGPYAWDWIKHWALVNALSSNDWPLQLDLYGAVQNLRFYVGAYLVPALIHKAIPGIGVPLAFACWLLLGYVLVFKSVAIAAPDRKMGWLAIFLLLSMGGADMFAEQAFRALGGLSFTPWFGLHHDAWTINTAYAPLEFSSMITALLWVPHQSIATFMVAALLIQPRGQVALGAAMLGFGLLAIWSPYGMVGLFPLMLLAAWQRRTELLAWQTRLAGLAGISFAIVVIAYLSTDLPQAGPCLECIPYRLGQLPGFMLFWLIELLCFAIILRERLIRDPSCLISLITLVVVSFVYGPKLDFVMRGSMGPLFILSLRSVETLLERGGSRWRKALQVAAVCICLPTAVSEVVYLRQSGTAYLAFPQDDPLSARWLRTFAVRNDYTVQEFLEICGREYLEQYFTREKPNLSP